MLHFKVEWAPYSLRLFCPTWADGLQKGGVVEQPLWKRRGQLNIQLLWEKICGRGLWKYPGGKLCQIVPGAF